MKLCANYDVSGKICSVTWFNAPDGVSLMLTPRPGELVTEVQGHDLTGEMPDEQTLRNLAKSYTIEEPCRQSRLRKKPPKE